MNQEEEVKGTTISDQDAVNPTTQNTTPTPKKGKFGVTKETQGGSVVPIPAPIKLPAHTEQYKTGYEFPVANLVSVFCDPAKKMMVQGVEEEKPVLMFVFKDKKDRQLTHVEFPVDETDAKYEQKMEWLNQRIKHIWDETLGDRHFPEEGLGSQAETFEEFFKDVADKFATLKVGEEGSKKTLYSQIPVYMKCTYNDKNRLQLPLFPNFVQRATDTNGKPVPVIALNIDPKYDTIEPKQKTSSTSGYSGGTDNTFGGTPSGSFDASDFPDV